jgi:hypothetical protein
VPDEIQKNLRVSQHISPAGEMHRVEQRGRGLHDRGRANSLQEPPKAKAGKVTRASRDRDVGCSETFMDNAYYP